MRWKVFGKCEVCGQHDEIVCTSDLPKCVTWFRKCHARAHKHAFDGKIEIEIYVEGENDDS